MTDERPVPRDPRGRLPYVITWLVVVVLVWATLAGGDPPVVPDGARRCPGATMSSTDWC